MKIIDYKYINHVYHDSLVKHIKEEIKEGWQPLGAIVQLKCADADAFVLVQAMVKYEEFSLSPGHIISGSRAENTKLKEEIHQLKKEIALLSERAQPRDGALKTCLEQNDLLKYTIDSNTVFIEALQKENEIYEKVIKSFIEKYMKPRGWNEPSWGIELDDSCYFSKDESTIKRVIEELFQMIIKWYKNENNR